MERAGSSVRPPWRARRAVGVVAVAVAGLLTAGGVPSAATTAPTRVAAVLPALGVSAQGLNFPDQPVGTRSAPQGVTITNDGAVTTVVSVLPVAAPYAIASDLCDGRTLAPGASCVVSVVFSPTGPGTPLGALNLTSQSGGAAAPARRSINLTGHAIAANLPPGNTSRVTQTAQGPAISDDGRYIVSAAYPTTDDGESSIVVRDQATASTEQLSAAGQRIDWDPTISGDGRLVQYTGSSTPGGVYWRDLWVVDRGTRTPAGAPTRHQVTNTTADLRFQRSIDCTEFVHDTCHSQISADGKSLVYIAWLNSARSSLLPDVTTGGETWPNDGWMLVDFSPGSASPTRQQVTLEPAEGPVTFSGPPVIEGTDADAFSVAGTTCQGTLAGDGSCTIDLVLDANGACGDTYFATLRTQSALTKGQLEIPLIATDPCESPTIPGDTLAQLPALPSATCGAMPTVQSAGSPADPARSSNAGVPLAQGVESWVGTGPVASSLVVTNDSDALATLRVDVDDCTAGLVVPEEVDPSLPAPCQTSTTLQAGAQCTAYMAFNPDSVGVYSATVAVTPVGSSTADWQWYRFLSSGLQGVVVERKDPSGTGDFAGPGRPAPQIVSIDTDGTVMDGLDPQVSGDGRYVAFTSRDAEDRADGGHRQQLYRHDTVTGTTELISVLPDGSTPVDRVAQPSLSRDGQRVAFATELPSSEGVVRGQVYVRDIAAGETVVASASDANPDLPGGAYSSQPSLSDDGTTVAYESTASDLVASSNGDPAVYVRYVDPDFAGAPTAQRFNELVSVTDTGAVPPAGSFSVSPAVDQDGSFIAFSSQSALVVTDTDGDEDVYVHRRAPQLSVQPVAVDFGQLLVDAESDPQTVTVRNAGPGPVRMGSATARSPFTLTTDDAGACTATVTLHRGQSCTVQAGFQPPTATEYDDLLLLPSSQGYLRRATNAVTLSGLGVVGRAALSVTPGRLNFAPHTLHIPNAPLPVTVRNVGNVPLELDAAVTSPAKDFTVTGTPCQATLDPGDQCRISVAFAPRKLGQRDGTLTVSGTPADAPGVPPAPPATVELDGTTIQPTLTAEPIVVRPGRIANAVGKNFPPDVMVKLSWTTGISTAEVDPDGKGGLTAAMLIFKQDILGPRQLVATIQGVGAVRSGPVLVEPLTGQPPDFVNRS